MGSPSDEVEHLVLAQIGQVAHREPHAHQVLHHLTWHKTPLGIDLEASGVGVGQSGDPPFLAPVGHVGWQPQTLHGSTHGRGRWGGMRFLNQSTWYRLANVSSTGRPATGTACYAESASWLGLSLHICIDMSHNTHLFVKQI